MGPEIGAEVGGMGNKGSGRNWPNNGWDVV